MNSSKENTIPEKARQSWCLLQNQLSGKCVTVYGASKNGSAKLVQYDRNEMDNQLWMLAPLTQIDDAAGSGREVFYLVNKHSGLLMTVHNASKEDYAQIIQYEFRSDGKDSNAQWFFEPDGDDCYAVRSVNSQKVIVVRGASKDNDADIIQYSFVSGHENGQFKLIPVSALPQEIFTPPEFEAVDASLPELKSTNVLDYMNDYNSFQLVARSVIPFFRVSDPDTDTAWKIQHSPCYFLDVSIRYGKNESWFTATTAKEGYFDYTITKGMSKETSEEFGSVVGLTVDASVGLKGIASISMEINVQSSYTIATAFTLTQEEMKTYSVTVPGRGAGCFWATQRKFSLTRLDGTPIKTWSAMDDPIYSGTFPAAKNGTKLLE